MHSLVFFSLFDFKCSMLLDLMRQFFFLFFFFSCQCIFLSHSCWLYYWWSGLCFAFCMLKCFHYSSSMTLKLTVVVTAVTALMLLFLNGHRRTTTVLSTGRQFSAELISVLLAKLDARLFTLTVCWTWTKASGFPATGVWNWN